MDDRIISQPKKPFAIVELKAKIFRFFDIV